MADDNVDDAKKTGKDIVSRHPSEESLDSNSSSKDVDPGASAYVPADFDHYSKLPVWTQLELACLSLGFEPELLINADLQSLQTFPDRFGQLKKRAQMVQRACHAQVLDNPGAPIAGLNWLKSIDETIPKGLIEKCSKYSVELVPVSTGIVKNVLNDIRQRVENVEERLEGDYLRVYNSGVQQRIDSLQRMMLGVACDKYGYDPEKARTPTAGLIAGATQRLGLDVDEGTVRSHLKAAAKKHLNEST